jgi:acetyl-CoA carboxylase biotin carboxyl carrier protein
MVGTFYRAPSPEADPFVREGDRVEENTVICIIEAMKVMNEISSGVSGVVQEILVKNGESVEYSQPLFRILLE